MKSTADLLKKPIRLEIFGTTKFVPLYVLLMGIGCVIIFFLVRNQLLRDQWRTLDVPKHGYSMEFPALWSSETYGSLGGRGKNLDYLSSSLSSFGLSVQIHQTQMEHADLNEAFEWWQNTMRVWDVSDISSPIEMEIGIGNYPAMMQTYYHRNEFVHAYYVVSDNRIYLIEFSKFHENYQHIVDHMLSTFSLEMTKEAG